MKKITLDMAKKHEFDVLVVAYRDRLTRFGFTYLQELFKAYGADVVAVFQEEPKDYMQELVEDMVEIVTSFAATFLVESDFIDDPNRPGVVSYPWSIVTEVLGLLSNNLVDEGKVRKVFIDNFEKVYDVELH